MDNIILFCNFGMEVYRSYRYARGMVRFFQDNSETFQTIWDSIERFGGILIGLEFNSLDLKAVAKDQDSADKLQNYFQSKKFLDELNEWLSKSRGDSEIKVTEMRKFVRSRMTLEKSFEIIRKESEKAMSQGTYYVGSSNSVSCLFRFEI